MAGAVPLAAPPALAAAGSPYEALRVGRAATQVEIKAAYRAMAKRLHPNTTRTPAAFLEIRRAYETLSDPNARARYDRSLGTSHHRPGQGVGGVRVRRWLAVGHRTGRGETSARSGMGAVGSDGGFVRSVWRTPACCRRQGFATSLRQDLVPLLGLVSYVITTKFLTAPQRSRRAVRGGGPSRHRAGRWLRAEAHELGPRPAQPMGD